ncbi:type II toxin-antitoxin system PemK/MazF family toxin, partial [Streptomyces hydrogenans]
PHPGFTPCTWTTTVTRDDLTERAGTLSSARLDAVEAALRRAARPSEWTPATAARFDAMRAALRPGAVDG